MSLPRDVQGNLRAAQGHPRVAQSSPREIQGAPGQPREAEGISHPNTPIMAYILPPGPKYAIVYP